MSMGTFGGVAEGTLDAHYSRNGAEYPGERVCSRIRWRIYLRKRAQYNHYAFPLYHESRFSRVNGVKIYQASL